MADYNGSGYFLLFILFIVVMVIMAVLTLTFLLLSELVSSIEPLAGKSGIKGNRGWVITCLWFAVILNAVVVFTVPGLNCPAYYLASYSSIFLLYVRSRNYLMNQH